MTARTPDPLEAILPLLHAGKYSTAIPQLEALSRSQPSRGVVFYNLGLALSETQQLPEAIIALKRCTRIDPTSARAFTALGVAYGRLRNFPEARAALAEAMRLDPSNPLIMQNLSGVLLMSREPKAALDVAREAFRMAPENERILWSLAECAYAWSLDPNSGDQAGQLRGEAGVAYMEYLERYPDSPMAERAEKALTQISQVKLRNQGVTADGFRPDVLEYILHAIRLFEEVGDGRRNQIVMEIAKLGAEGLDINNPDIRHPIPSLPGDYTALQLVSFMYTGMQQVDPSVFPGIDFSREYEMALAMKGKPPQVD